MGDDYIYSKPSIREPIKFKKLVKWENLPIDKCTKSYNYNQKEKLMEIMKRMEKNPENPENPENTQALPTKEYIAGNISNYVKSTSSILESPDMKERIKKISEKYKKN